MKILKEQRLTFPKQEGILPADGIELELQHQLFHGLPVSSADFETSDPETVVAQMQEAMARVAAGYVSPAIRDADMNGVHINKGDTIGIIEKQIVVSEEDRMKAAKALASILLDYETKFMLTIFTGEDAIAEDSAVLESFINEKYPSAEVYFVDGGQAIYPYIFVAE